jgi:hypothetical protein
MSNMPGGSSGSSKPQPLYGVWIHSQVKSILDEANQRKGEVSAEASSAVQEALKHLEDALAKLHPHAK